MSEAILKFARVKRRMLDAHNAADGVILAQEGMKESEFKKLEQDVCSELGDGGTAPTEWGKVQITNGGEITWVPLAQNIKQARRKALLLKLEDDHEHSR